MIINDNGVYRDMTAEEEAEYLHNQAIEMPKTAEERIAELEAALGALLSGRTEL